MRVATGLHINMGVDHHLEYLVNSHPHISAALVCCPECCNGYRIAISLKLGVLYHEKLFYFPNDTGTGVDCETVTIHN